MTPTVQVAGTGPMLGLQVLPVMAKLPVAAMLENVTAVVSLFVQVTLCAAVVSPTGVPAKLKLAGDTVTGATPLPVSEAVCGLWVALSVTVRVPLNEPNVSGWKVIRIVQLAPAASLVGLSGQVVLALANSPVTAMLVMVSAPLLAFCRVAVLAALVLPSTWLPNAKVAGESVTVVCALSGKAIAKTIPENKIQLRAKPLFIVYPADPLSLFLKPGVVSSV